MATAGKNLSAYNPKDLPDGAHYIVGIAVSEWNSEYTNGMLEGALEVLRNCGVKEENIKVIYVPGSFELPLASQMLLEHTDAVIAIGSVIRGETSHFDYVCEAVSQGIKDVNLKTGKPVAFCVLTDNTAEQAAARSGGEHGNKGTEAAVVVMKMLAIKSDLR
ncbi:MAG TPA: 6,7-dimethyl-8-ribityllumazine synthase [Flavobacteriales bacterium]|jgi:6,7-dimethyl-8-ribityllumazine synthase|nr:6,7-dimethyl-8-ribityllumazine synthase [Flavobacteriales bacterium]HIB77602.1 6,7-dimethyl-8-ribityllumazine synthase [Flavobacteriales bacterium]HIN41394.1 6,7-dimethyl-8-ribityllumazine synthase [Flavobacteriales bacterium]HIO15939.1 6,7-dimethyl-8-ribityllumazine synthase [Flavobacteriales bacterium]HIO59486.1 6,7-dimethyl-8-ribityllumazine synthase [Flavobacteriales bacterium]